MGAEDLAQRGVEQVRAGVIAADGVAALAIDDGVDVVADGQRLLEHGLVGAHALHGKNAAGDFGDGGVAVGGGEPAGVADLAAGVAVEAGVVEDDFDLRRRLLAAGTPTPSLTMARTSASLALSCL